MNGSLADCLLSAVLRVDIGAGKGKGSAPEGGGGAPALSLGPRIVGTDCCCCGTGNHVSGLAAASAADPRVGTRVGSDTRRGRGTSTRYAWLRGR